MINDHLIAPVSFGPSSRFFPSINWSRLTVPTNVNLLPTIRKWSQESWTIKSRSTNCRRYSSRCSRVWQMSLEVMQWPWWSAPRRSHEYFPPLCNFTQVFQWVNKSLLNRHTANQHVVWDPWQNLLQSFSCWPWQGVFRCHLDTTVWLSALQKLSTSW